jgi:CheY-like chemotaxis protein
MQQILSALLEAGGHQLKIVADGRDAVAMAASDTFDIILMDVMMPVMDGPTATQRIRELGGRAGGSRSSPSLPTRLWAIVIGI